MRALRGRGRSLTTLLVIAALPAGAFLVAGCGDDDSVTATDSGSQVTKQGPGNPIDHAFAKEMTAHHELAVEMAKIAGRRAQSPEIKALARRIRATQTAEIRTLEASVSRLARAGVSEGELGLGEHDSGTDTDTDALAKANPFDREFIDQMVPHHQGAIRMARVELRRGQNQALRSLAQSIIRTQSAEIDEMNAHRTEAFGGPSPAGGVPAEDDSERDTSTTEGHGEQGGGGHG